MRKISLPDTSAGINRLFDFFNSGFGGKVLSAGDVFARAGLTGLSVVALLSVVLSFVLTARYGLPFVSGLFFAVTAVSGCVFLHYAAFMMLPALKTLLQNAPTKISSCGILRVAALFVGFSGVMMPLYGLTAFGDSSDVTVTFSGMEIEADCIALFSLASFVFCEFWVFLLLNPSALNVEVVEKTSVGEEFIGLTSYFAKGCLKLTPVVFGTAIVLAVVLQVVMIFDSSALLAKMPVLILLCFSAFLPLLVYLSFLSYYFILDILASVLQLKSDK